MGIGQSGGRSRGNRQAPAAEFRATKRERDGIDPPGLTTERSAPSYAPVRLTARGQSLMAWAGLGVWIGTWAGFALVVFKWWGLI